MLFFLIALTGCGGLNLSEQDAQTLVKSSKSLPHDYPVIIRNSSDNEAILNLLQQNGLITWKFKWGNDYNGHSFDCDIYPTDKGKGFFLGKSQQQGELGIMFENYMFKGYTMDFNQIVGISVNKENQTATVRYSQKATQVSPFAQLLANNTKFISQPLTSDITEDVIFKKFDTGWQLATN